MTAACKKCLAGDLCGFTHGTLSAYTYHKCRCDLCALTWREYQREFRANLDPGRKAKYAATQREYHHANRTRLSAYALEYRQDPAVRARVRELQRESHDRHREERNAKSRQRQGMYPRDPEKDRQKGAQYRRTERYRRELERRRSIPNPRGGQPWTADDDAVIARDDISVVEMCYLIGRSWHAVNHRRRVVRYGDGYKRRPFTETRACLQCGGTYLARTNRAKFCSDTCKGRYYRQAYPERHRAYEANRPKRKR